MSLILTDGDTYVHIDDHRHNPLTWHAVYFWWFRCALPIAREKRIWQSEITVIPLRHFNGQIQLMAKKATKTDENKERGNPEFIGFVNISLNDDELALIDAALEGSPLHDMPNHMDYLLELGKLSFNYTRGSIQCTLTVLEGSSAGYAVSGYSDTLIEAILLTRMKVQNYLDKFPDIYKNGGTKKRRG